MIHTRDEAEALQESLTEREQAAATLTRDLEEAKAAHLLREEGGLPAAGGGGGPEGPGGRVLRTLRGARGQAPHPGGAALEHRTTEIEAVREELTRAQRERTDAQTEKSVMDRRVANVEEGLRRIWWWTGTPLRATVHEKNQACSDLEGEVSGQKEEISNLWNWATETERTRDQIWQSHEELRADLEAKNGELSQKHGEVVALYEDLERKNERERRAAAPVARVGGGAERHQGLAALPALPGSGASSEGAPRSLKRLGRTR